MGPREQSQDDSGLQIRTEGRMALPLMDTDKTLGAAGLGKFSDAQVPLWTPAKQPSKQAGGLTCEARRRDTVSLQMALKAARLNVIHSQKEGLPLGQGPPEEPRGPSNIKRSSGDSEVEQRQRPARRDCGPGGLWLEVGRLHAAAA